MAVCKILTSEEEIAAIADEWRALQSDIGLAPFTSHSWALAWWNTIGKPSGAKFIVVACYEKDELIGLIPFSIRTKAGVRVMRLIGHEVYYYRNFLVREPTLMPLIWDAVLAYNGYDFANIKNLHEGTEEDRFFDGRASKIGSSEVYYCGDLGETRDEFVHRYSKAFRRKIRRTQTFLDKEPGLEIDYCRGEPVPEDVIEFLVRRKLEWVEERGKRGLFDEKDPLSFYKEIIHTTAKEGKLLLYWMRMDGEVVASVFSVIEKDTLYGHTMAFDRRAGKYAPGIFLSMESIIWASENGFIENNFMEGEEEYKRRFCKTSRTIHEYSYARTLLGTLYLRLYQGICFLRSLRTHEEA